MKSIISSAVIALLAISATAQNGTVGNTTIPITNSTDNVTVPVPIVVVPTDNTTNATNATDNGTVPVVGGGDNGTEVDNGTVVNNETDNSTIGGDNNGTDNGTEVIPGNGNGNGNGNNIVIIDPNAVVPCQDTNQTQCAFVFGTEFCCINAGGNRISDNSVFGGQFCYNQTLLNTQRASGLQYGDDATLNSLACLGGNFLQLTGAAIFVGAATLLF